MKIHFIKIYILLLAVVLYNCKEDHIGQFPTDNIAPKQISNVTVKNLPGAVDLIYDIPDEEDLLYVMAVYNLSSGETVKKASVFNNTMSIEGFGKSQKSSLQLFSVDGSQNKSEPVTVEIEPLDSPIYDIQDNMDIQVSFGGFKLSWVNATKMDLVVCVLEKNETTGELNYVDNFYSSAESVTESVRGQDSTLHTYGIFLRDTYENYTDTVMISLKPYHEEQVPKSGFVACPLSSIFNLHSYGPSMSNIWDDITNVDNNLYYIATGNTTMPFFTFDMGVTVKLSRFRLWQRVNYLFALHNPKNFEWYGTNDKTVANDASDLNWETNPAWTKLMTCVSHKPSGDNSGTVTSEDDAYAKDGEEFEFPLDAPAVRYLRFKLISTWGGSTGVHINELTFWGQVEK